MQKTCKQCSAQFEITSEDLAFYEKVSPVFHGKKELIPPPTLCPECRMQRRLAWRNERNLYHSKSTLSGKQIISLYSGEKSLSVYPQDEFWSDSWDQHKASQSIDLNTSLMHQLSVLQTKSPRIALLSKNSVNSDYTNHATDNKDCYLSTVLFRCEEVFYSRKVFACKNIVDCLYIFGNSELLYECFWVEFCYRSTYLRRCFQMTDSHFCIDCRECNHCILCTNLRHKKYCIMNEQLTEKEYFSRAQAYLGKNSSISFALRLFNEIAVKAVYPRLEIRQAENCSGDYLFQCNDCTQCFDCAQGDTLRYCIECDAARKTTVSHHCMDVFGFGNCEWIYEVQAQANGHGSIVNNFSYDVKNCTYIDNCHNCSHCFACIGLRNAEYCILNKQYTKEEYETLVPKIIAKMRADGEWGEFFPASMSPFGYNETVAQEYFPLTKEEVLKRGWKWHDEEEKRDQYMGPPYVIPDDITNVSDDITKHILTCEVTGKPYKIIPQELKFYREMGIPIPRRCPDQRHKDRMALRNPRKLWKRQCAKCAAAIETTYAPERPEIVYCETCYLSTVY